jgi:nicotinamide-nucleotide amidase
MDRVALLATGDEIINGDILNTNGKIIAEMLIQNGLQPGMHMVASDDQDELLHAMHFLLQHHDALITIGGLGPTSDDRTRFALAKSLNLELIFDDNSWEHIVNRLNQFNLEIPESNKQQCLFPEGATILENKNGTANACKINHSNKHIYMLPGPPNECLPLFEQAILPDLLNTPLAKKEYRKNWLLFGVSEGRIAEDLDTIVAPFDAVIGYRVAYPYLEVKLHSHDESAFNAATTLLLKNISDHVISECREHASVQLHRSIVNTSTRFLIDDAVTGGLLQTALLSPETYPNLRFDQSANATAEDTLIKISGLNEYWNIASESQKSQITMIFKTPENTHTFDIAVPYRGLRMKAYAMEAICIQLLSII